MNEVAGITYDEFLTIVADSLGLKKNELHKDASFLHDIGVDSLSLMNFILKLEKKYEIRFELPNIWELKNIKETYSMFLSALENRGTVRAVMKIGQ